MAEVPGAIPVLGEILERTVVEGADVIMDATSNRKNNTVGSSSLRPIQATIGKAFPSPHPDRFYGQYKKNGHSQQVKETIAINTRNTRTTITTSAGNSVNGSVGFTAHVQPIPNNSESSTGIGLDESGNVMTSMVHQHQWEPKEFDDLERGYYTVPLTSSMNKTSTTENPVNVIQGEAYVELLLRFLRSTVRKHRECAITALRARLLLDPKLRERCAFGPDCAQLVHLIITEVSVGHIVPCTVAAECLILLFYDAVGEVTEAVGEIGTPPTDASAASTATSTTTTGISSTFENDKDMKYDESTFAELSEWMRSGEDRARSLDKLGLTGIVIDQLQLLPPQLAARLLLGSGVILLPSVAIRIASDPRFAHFVKERIGSVVLGKIKLEEITEELLLLRRILHVKEACTALLPLLHESFVLFLRYVCAVPVSEIHSVSELIACLAAFLVLRALMRHGFFGVFYDISDALLSCKGVGVCIPAEMWLLMSAGITYNNNDNDDVSNNDGSIQHMSSSSSLSSRTMTRFGGELARDAIRAISMHVEIVEKSGLDEISVENCASLLTALTSMHYLATYFTVYEGLEEVMMLLGSVTETKRTIQQLMAKNVLTSEGLQRAFIRLNNNQSRNFSSSSSSCIDAHTNTTITTSVNMQNYGVLETKTFQESCWASLTHARVRLAAAVSTDITLFGIESDAIMGYVAALAVSFEDKCMNLRQVIGHLLPDELCTMIEIVQFMHQQTHTVSDGKEQRYKREAYIAEIFVLHSIALTKHGLDAASKIIKSIIGIPDNIDLSIDENQTQTPLETTTTTTRIGEKQTSSLSLSSDLVELGKSLCRAVIQSQWPWFLFPLYDEKLINKSEWSAWLQRTLGVHQRMKHLLQWDLILCHLLKWSVSHREIVRDWQTSKNNNNNNNNNDKNAMTYDNYYYCSNHSLLNLLESLYCGVLPQAGVSITAAASDTLKALTAYAAPHAEESMTQSLFEALTITATASDPSITVAIVRLLSHTILEVNHHDDNDEYACVKERSDASGVGSSSFKGMELLRRWAATGRLSDAAPKRGVVLWDLENFVELLLLLQSESTMCMDGDAIIMLRLLVEGIAVEYLHQHQPLSAFECSVLGQTQEEASWLPACLCEALMDPSCISH